MPKVSIYIKSFPLWYRKPCGTEVEIITMGDREHQANKPFFFQSEGRNYEHSETEAALRGPAQVCSRYRPGTKGCGHSPHYKAQKPIH